MIVVGEISFPRQRTCSLFLTHPVRLYQVSADEGTPDNRTQAKQAPTMSQPVKYAQPPSITIHRGMPSPFARSSLVESSSSLPERLCLFKLIFVSEYLA